MGFLPERTAENRWRPESIEITSDQRMMYTPRTELMNIAIGEAIASRQFEEHPIGALIVQGNEIISQSGNRTHRDTNPTHHAEIVAIGMAAKRLGRKNLHGCILYSTHEPCPMCAAASVYARIAGIVFGTSTGDATRFVTQHPQVSWRSFDVSSSAIIYSGDHLGLFVIEGFMKQQCITLFNLLLAE